MNGANSTGIFPDSSEYFPLYRLSYMWYAPLGFLLTILIAQITSRIVNWLHKTVGKPSHKIDEQLLSPLFPKYFRSSEYLQERAPEQMASSL